MRYLSVCLLACIVGCSQASRAERMSVDEVPENVMVIAREKLPDVTFDQALQKSDGIYEVSGKDSRGKVREIEISPEGEIVEIE